MIDLPSLEALRRMERDRDELQSLSDGFAGDVAAYIQKLETSIPAADNYHEADLLRDELRNAKELYESIVDLRAAKIIDRAVMQSVNNDGLKMLPAEAALFSMVFEAVERHREEMLKPLGVVHTYSK